MKLYRGPMILLISNVAAPVIGGISTYLTALQNGLAAHHIPSHLLSLSPRQIMRAHQLRWRWLARLYYMLTVGWLAVRSVAWMLWYRLRGYRVIAHSHSANYCLLISVLLRALGCRGIHTFHSPLTRRCPHLTRYASRVDAIVYVSEFQRTHYQTICPMQPKRVAIVPGAVDETRFRPATMVEQKANRQRLGIPEKAVVIIFTGRLVRTKGAHLMVEALLRLPEDSPPWYALLVGGAGPSAEDAAYLRELRDMIEDRHLAGRVNLLGAISDIDAMIACYHTADIATCLSLIPAFPEMSPMVLIEAMACGLPVIGSQNGSIPDRIADGKTGYVVDVNESSDLTQAFHRLITDHPLRARMGAAARRTVLRQYTHAQIIRAYCQLYGLAPLASIEPCLATPLTATSPSEGVTA